MTSTSSAVAVGINLLSSLTRVLSGQRFKTSSKILTELCDMSQTVGGREIIRLLVPLPALRLLDRDQLAHSPRQRRQRLGIGLARSCSFGQIGEMFLMRIELTFGGAPKLAHHPLA
ncbi:hypothetical protein ACXIUS_01965 [Bosea thiooxidans]